MEHDVPSRYFFGEGMTRNILGSCAVRLKDVARRMDGRMKFMLWLGRNDEWSVDANVRSLTAQLL